MEAQLSQKAFKDLDRLPEPVFSQIQRKIENLSTNPYPAGIKRLVNWPGFRLRVGDYRVLYEVDPKRKLILIYRVAHRRDAYRLS